MLCDAPSNWAVITRTLDIQTLAVGGTPPDGQFWSAMYRYPAQWVLMS
jgi:hypothetical protein